MYPTENEIAEFDKKPAIERFLNPLKYTTTIRSGECGEEELRIASTDAMQQMGKEIYEYLMDFHTQPSKNFPSSQAVSREYKRLTKDTGRFIGSCKAALVLVVGELHKENTNV